MWAIILLGLLASCQVLNAVPTPQTLPRIISIRGSDGALYTLDRAATRRDLDAYSTYADNVVEPSLITLYLYTSAHHDPEGTAFNLASPDMAQLAAAGFDPTVPTIFMSHGWTVNHHSQKTFPAALFPHARVNVFLVDYATIAKYFYTAAVAVLPSVGAHVAAFIEDIVATHEGMTMDHVWLAGHSMGGQLSGFIGQALGGRVHQIVGIDPAGPLFEDAPPEFALDRTDAQFVHVIHTNSGLLGLRRPVGHADFYPNGGGMTQPGCGIDIIGLCAHIRAWEFLLESLQPGATEFRAVPCASYEAFQAGECNNNYEASVYMGKLELDKSASGSYYLSTADSSPYALG